MTAKNNKNMTHAEAHGIAYALSMIAADLLAWLFAYWLAVDYTRITVFKFEILGAAWLMWMAVVVRAYSLRQSFWAELGKTLQALLMLTVVGVLLKLLIGNPHSLSDWLKAIGVLLVALPTLRWLAKTLLAKTRYGWLPAIIFGGGENAWQAKLALDSEPGLGLRVVGFAVPPKQWAESANHPQLKWPGTASDFTALHNHACIVALEASQSTKRDALLRQFAQYGLTDVHVIPAMRGVPLFGLYATQFFSHEVLMLKIKNNLARPFLRATKRGFDVLGASTLLLLLSPVFAFLAYKVSRDGGPPFFGHVRIGENGKEFKCYKFRSMVVNAQQMLQELLANDPQAREEWEQDFKLKNDPRISRVGHFLRKTSLDELPQLWNVLKGDMSLVGPRPVVKEELQRYGNDLPFYLMAKPGITGLWQVSGRNGVDYATRVYFDAWYVKNWSLWTDIVILLKTIQVVIKKDGAY